MDILTKYFPNLDRYQLKKFENLAHLYKYWNDKLNLISRNDVMHLYERHVLHSLSIAKFIQFKDKTQVLDLGTGGGFPGIPLAILFPEVQFHLIDAIQKKIKAVHTISIDLGLQNVKIEQVRAENLREKYDFILARAVAEASQIIKWTRPYIRPGGFNDLPNGYIMLKGGALQSELSKLSDTHYAIGLSEYFEEDFFATKSLVYVTL